MAKKTEEKKTGEKKWTRRSDEELLQEALERAKELQARIDKKALSKEQKELLKKGRSPLINLVNKLELGEVKAVIELLRENGYLIEVKPEAAKALGMNEEENKEENAEDSKEDVAEGQEDKQL